MVNEAPDAAPITPTRGTIVLTRPWAVVATARHLSSPELF